MDPELVRGACKALCVVLLLLSFTDMLRAARADEAPLALRAACIVGDGLVMYFGTQLLWWPPFL